MIRTSACLTERPFRCCQLFLVAAALLVLNSAMVWGLDPRKDISHYIIDEWSTDNSNIPQNSVLSMAQTRDGYLWAGTYEGLCRFDGLYFTVFDKSNTPEIQNNSILVMAEGPDGALWAGTPNGLLCRRDAKFRNYTVADGLSGDFILALAFDRRGSLWVGTTQGLSCFCDGVFVRIKGADGVELSYISALCAGADGMLWIGTNDGIFAYQAGRFSTHVLPGDKSNNSIWSLCLARDGALWIGTAGNWLVTYRNGAFRRYSGADGLSGNRVRVIYEDRSGTLWVGTDDGGLDRFEGGTFSSIGTAHGPLNDSIRAMVEDHEGSLWVGTFGGGLSRLKDDRYIFYTTRNGLPVDMTRSVMQDRAGNVWIGTIGGGLVRFSAGRFQTIDIGTGPGEKRVWSIAQAGDDAIWIGTYGHGLHRLKDGKQLVYTTRNGLANDIVRAVLAARDGSIWAGSNGGGIDVLLSDGRIVNYSRRNGLGDDFIYAISQDDQGTIWVGTYNGDLYRFREGKFTVYQPRFGTSQNAIWAIHPDPDGALWLGTNSGGLIRFKNNQFRAISSRDGLYNDVAFQILEDDHGFFWMNCNRGVYRVAKQELNDFADGRIPRVHSLSFGVSEGVRGVESSGPAQPAGWKTRDGMLWFPTIKGVAVVDPDYRKRNERMPLVHIEQMTVEGVAVDLSSPLAFEPGRKKLEFTFTALSFLVSGKNRFKTWLQGFDPGWSAETSQRQISYTNLPPGQYAFRVIACNNDGVWNMQGATLHFVLRPFFFQTFWFWAGVVGALLGLAVLAARWRFRSLERRERELEAQVRERTTQLSHVNEELLQANRVQDEMQRIAVHDLKNPLQAIMGAADLIMQQNRSLPGGAMLAEKVSLASKRMLALVNEMLEISRFERGDFKLELQTVDLSELLTLVGSGFSEQMQRKGQKLVLALEPQCLVTGDLEWLKEIFDNLLSNAVKFSNFQAEIKVSTLCREKTVLVVIRDQGPGLTTEDQKKLFGKFQRLSAKPTGGESSTGLGLSIAELLVRKHGGRIWAESEPGQGSSFHIELPRA